MHALTKFFCSRKTERMLGSYVHVYYNFAKRDAQALRTIMIIIQVSFVVVCRSRLFPSYCLHHCTLQSQIISVITRNVCGRMHGNENDPRTNLNVHVQQHADTDTRNY